MTKSAPFIFPNGLKTTKKQWQFLDSFALGKSVQCIYENPV